MLGPHCGPNASSDLADSLVNSFGRVGASQNNVSGWGRPSVYKKTTSTSDEKRSANTHPSSDLPSYEPYDTSEPLSRPHTCCESHILDVLCEQLKLLVKQHSDVQTRTMTMGDSGSQSPMASHAAYPVMPHPGQPGALRFDGKNISEFLDDWNLELRGLWLF